MSGYSEADALEFLVYLEEMFLHYMSSDLQNVETDDSYVPIQCSLPSMGSIPRQDKKYDFLGFYHGACLIL